MALTRQGNAGIRVEGMEQTLKALRKLDSELYKASINNIRSPIEAAQILAQSRYPERPLSGWRTRKAKAPVPPRAFPPYNPSRARQGVKVVVNKRTGKSASTYKLGALVQINAGGAIYDMAKNSPNNFSTDLRGGSPSRIMWPSMRAMQTRIVAAIKKAQTEAEMVIHNMMPNKRVTS